MIFKLNKTIGRTKSVSVYIETSIDGEAYNVICEFFANGSIAIKTDFNNAVVRSNPQVKSMIAANTAMGRTGMPEDIGGIVAFLCSPEAGWINAQRIKATGGVWL